MNQEPWAQRTGLELQWEWKCLGGEGGFIRKRKEYGNIERVAKTIMGPHSVRLHPNSVGSHSPIKSFCDINKKQHKARANTSSKMTQIEGVRPPGNQRSLEKNNSRNLTLSGVLAEMSLWDHP